MKISTDYRDILRSELDRRQAVNPAYSMRSFARDLEMSPANLSQIFSKKNGLSPEKAKKVSKKLRMSQLEAAMFGDLVASENGRSKKAKIDAKTRLEKYGDSKLLEIEYFKAIEDWYHFAVLELAKTKKYHNAASSSHYLGIPSKVIANAISRLKSLKLLTEKTGQLHATSHRVLVGEDVPARAIRNFHLQIIDRARKALSNQPVQDREFSSTMLAIKSENIPQAKEMLRDFRREFSRRFAENSEGDDVYCLSVQFFNLKSEHG